MKLKWKTADWRVFRCLCWIAETLHCLYLCVVCLICVFSFRPQWMYTGTWKTFGPNGIFCRLKNNFRFFWKSTFIFIPKWEPFQKFQLAFPEADFEVWFGSNCKRLSLFSFRCHIYLWNVSYDTGSRHPIITVCVSVLPPVSYPLCPNPCV